MLEVPLRWAKAWLRALPGIPLRFRDGGVCGRGLLGKRDVPNEMQKKSRPEAETSGRDLNLQNYLRKQSLQ